MDGPKNDVREALEGIIEWLRNGADSIEIADAILARWDLVEKPAVSVEELGRMVNQAATFGGPMSVGGKFLMELERAGLTIVRSGEAAR